jgi:hypothetical protein
MASRLGSYAETAFSTAPEAHAKRRLLARKMLGNDSSAAEGRDIQESVRQKREEDEKRRRAAAVREHVPPPKGVSLQDTEALAMEEKATRMFPSMAEEARRKMGLAPYAAPPSRSLDWWNK